MDDTTNISLETSDSNKQGVNKIQHTKSAVLTNKLLEKELNDQKDYSGRYEATGKNDCKLVLLIDGLKYEAKTNKRTQSGTIKVVKENTDTFFLFQGLLGDDRGKDIQGKYEDETIIIQNYGNSMNPYTRIGECEGKYLQLKKINNKSVKETPDSSKYALDSLAFLEKKSTLNIESNYKIIWEDLKVKIYANHSIIKEGEERLVIYSSNKDTLLNFLHDEGGKIAFPFAINNKDEVFINFFEVWGGSGFLSEKHFFHLDKHKYTLNKVKNINIKNVLKAVKTKFDITDSIYIKKGEFYKNFAFDKTCFNENGELPFTMILYNYDKPKLNKGLEGFKTINGVYRFEKLKRYTLKPTKIELKD